MKFKERSGVDTAQFVTLCGNDCFYSRVESEGFVDEFECLMANNSLTLDLFKVMVTDSGGAIYSLWDYRQQFSKLYSGKRVRESKRGECRALVKRLRSTRSESK